MTRREEIMAGVASSRPKRKEKHPFPGTIGDGKTKAPQYLRGFPSGLPGVGGSSMEQEAKGWKFGRQRKHRERIEKEWAENPGSRTPNPKFPHLA